MTRRLFTPAEANRTLPLVKRIVRDILETGREYRTLGEQHEAASEADVETERRLDELQANLRGLFTELSDIGCEYKDWGFDKGLVDFPGEIDGESVLWCWRSDKESLAWYHDHESGFAGRAPIPAELLQAHEPSDAGPSR